MTKAECRIFWQLSIPTPTKNRALLQNHDSTLGLRNNRQQLVRHQSKLHNLIFFDSQENRSIIRWYALSNEQQEYRKAKNLFVSDYVGVCKCLEFEIYI